MAFLDPSSLFEPFQSVAQGVTGGQTYDPIITTLPNTLKAFANKYSNPDIQSYLTQLPPNIAQPLIDLDRQRVLRGQQPISKKQFVQAAETARTGVPYTAPPGKKATNIVGNTLSDLRAITQSIPKIPFGLYHEARDLGNIGEQLGQVHDVGDIFRLPGVRMVPGAYIAGNLLGGEDLPTGGKTSVRQGVQELATHPLFSFLDVLPLAKETGLSEAAAGTRAGQAVKAAKTAATEAIGRTRPGMFLKEALSAESRATAHAQNIETLRMQEIMNPDSKTITDAHIAAMDDPLATTARSIGKLQKQFNIPKERMPELTRLMEQDRNLITDPVEQGYVDQYQQYQDQLAQINSNNALLQNIGGEWYDAATARRITKAQAEVDQWTRAWAGAPTPTIGKKIRTAQNRLDALTRKTAPARFKPYIQSQLENRMKLAYGTPENIEEVTRHIAEHNYNAIPNFDEAEYRTWQRDLNKQWQDFRDQGIDPMFVHRVSPSTAAGMKFQKVLETVRTPSQVRARTNDATPYVKDATVALNHQALEMLSRQGSENFAEAINDMHGVSGGELRAQFTPTAQRRAERNPQVDFGGHLQDLIDREYVKYDPTEFIPWKSPRMTALAADTDRYIPKTVYHNLRRMHNPVTNGLTAALDPVMGVFRTAVLPLSPRWHLNNIMGGGIAVAAESPQAFRWSGKARELLKTGKTVINGETVELPEEMRLMLGGHARNQAEFQFRAGMDLGKITKAINNERLVGNWNKIKEWGGKVTNKSYELNALFDDFYRAVGYLEGYSKTAGEGGRVLSTAEREAAGMALAKKVMQSWTDLTPIERSVGRYVFPFYGFMQHITRFALRYPMDHPFRAAVMGSLARTEMDDLGTGLPEKFLNSFFLGHPDKNGVVKTIQLGGMNPFRDVANYFTLAGLLGNTNPVFNTIAQELGIDTQTGAPGLYPDLQFDAQTGRLKVNTGNPLQNLVQNTLPQSRVLLGLAQSSSEFKDLMKRDPEAAGRLMRSQLGLPVLFAHVNVPQEEAKAEIARATGQQQAFQNALKTGKDEEARRYPALRPLLDQIRQLQASGQLNDYIPQQETISPLHLAQQAILAQSAPNY